MGRVILIVAAIVITGGLCGYAHYAIAAPNNIYSGDIVTSQESYDKFLEATQRYGVTLLDHNIKMSSGDRVAFTFSVRVDNPDFEYGEFKGNKTADNAKLIAIVVICCLFFVVGAIILIRRWLLARELYYDYY